MPAPINKIKAMYRYQWIIRIQNVRPLLKMLRQAQQRHETNGVHIAVDVDAVNMM